MIMMMMMRKGLALAALGLAAQQVLASVPAGLSTHEKDLLCACRAFRTPVTHMELVVERDLNGKDVACEAHGFSARWVALFKADSELGVGWGLRAQVYVNRPEIKPAAMLVAFKHFEGRDTDSYVDRDGWQMFAYHGDETGKDYYGERLAYWLSTSTQLFRHLLAIDYSREASNMMKEILERPSTPSRLYFTGFGGGGTIAAIQASRLKHTSAVVFMAHGTGTMLPFFGYMPTKRTTNIVVQGAEGYILGKQANRVCVLASGEQEPRANVLEYLYNPDGLISNTAKRTCYDDLSGNVGFIGVGGGGNSTSNADASKTEL